MDATENAQQKYVERVRQQLGHPDFPLINEHTRFRAASAADLSARTGISIAATYRLVDAFEETGLLVRGADAVSPRNPNRLRATYLSNVATLLSTLEVSDSGTSHRLHLTFRDSRPEIRLHERITDLSRRERPLQVKTPEIPSENMLE